MVAFTDSTEIDQQLVDEFPKNSKYRRNLAIGLNIRGVTYSDLKQYDQALTDYTKAFELHPDKEASLRNNAAWLLSTCPDPRIRDPKRAVELAEKANELSPKDGNILNTLGVAYYRATQYKSAIEALRKSTKLQGENSFDFFFLAMAHWQRGETDEARQWFDKAVKWMETNKPDDEELRRFRAEAESLLDVPVVAPKPEKGEHNDSQSGEPGVSTPGS